MNLTNFIPSGIILFILLSKKGDCFGVLPYNVSSDSPEGSTTNTYSIQGVVMFQNYPTTGDFGQFAPGFGCAPVFLLQNGNVVLSVKSSNDSNKLGHFDFENLPEGTYTLELGHMDGYTFQGGETFPNNTKSNGQVTFNANASTNGNLVILGLSKN